MKAPVVDPGDLAEALRGLVRLSRDALAAQWSALYGAPPPPRTSRSLMLRAVAYKLQEQAYGGLSPATRRIFLSLGDVASAGPVPRELQPPWQDFEISAYVDQAKLLGRQSMALAAMLAVCLGQREGDVLALARTKYDADAVLTTAGGVVLRGAIEIKQHKTGKRLRIPVLPELRREIALAPVKGVQFVISEDRASLQGGQFPARPSRDLPRRGPP